MRDVDRIVASLLASDAPLERAELESHGHRIRPDVAPLAPPEAVTRAVDAIVGLGPLEGLVADPDVSDVLVNAPGDVWVERNGRLQPTDVSFRDGDDVVAMVRRLVSPLGLRIDRAQPAVDARLPDGSRLHALIPPAAVDGPVVAIRRFHPAVGGLDDLVARRAIDEPGAATLREAVADRRNVLVAGPTGAGKTTLLNVLCSLIPDTDRLVTIEDAAELAVRGHVVRLEARSANIEGAGGITIRHLLRHALRLRPDRIIVGEVRGPEALDMVQALNTGHDGSMSTVHANGPDQALVRLTTLAATAPDDVPHEALEALVRAAIDIVVMVGRRDGRRCVTDIVEVGRRGSAP